MCPTPAMPSPTTGHGFRFGQGSPTEDSMHDNSQHCASFPLPHLEEPRQARSRGRRLRERARKEAAVFKATNEVVDSLNFLGGEVNRAAAGIQPAISLAEAPPALQTLHEVCLGVDFEPAGEEASLKAVLRGRGGDYENSDPTQGALASFSLHALALPESTATAPSSMIYSRATRKRSSL